MITYERRLYGTLVRYNSICVKSGFNCLFYFYSAVKQFLKALSEWFPNVKYGA